MPQIVFNHLSVWYANKKENVLALDDLCATLHPGFNVVLGCSGCGKTTLLKTLVGLLEYNGSIQIDGKEISRTPINERDMAMVSQQHILYPHKTIFDNIAFPLKVKKVPVEEIKKRVYDLAELFELKACLSRKPRQISGGQQQRVALARALIKEPSICLLDEPLSNVDQKFRAQSRVFLKNALKRLGSTVVYVTHNVFEAMNLADYLIVLDKGKIVVSGTTDKVYNSGNSVFESLKSGLSDFGFEG